MKKIIFLFGVTYFIMISCSESDSKSTTNILPKSVITTTEPGNQTTITNYSYSGTKYETVSTASNSKSVYIYNGDILSRVEIKLNDLTTSYTDYVYENGDLKSKTLYNINASNIAIKSRLTQYTYTGNDVLEEKTDYSSTGTPTINLTKTVSTYDDNNLIKNVTTTVFDNDNNTVVTEEYLYDTKPNYYINATGQPSRIIKSKNNVVIINSKRVIKTSGVFENPVTTQNTYQYTYNASGYVTEFKTFISGTLSLTTKIFYN
jgi:hypothetical protein